MVYLSEKILHGGLDRPAWFTCLREYYTVVETDLELLLLGLALTLASGQSFCLDSQVLGL